MDFSGTQNIRVAITDVWTYLLDVNKVASCAPGFQSLEMLGPEHWRAIVAFSVGPVKAKFNLDVTRPELHEPDLMVVNARGKAPGNVVDVQGKMRLSAVGEKETQMDWQAHVAINGTLAAVGARLMNSTAEKLTEQFFACLKSNLQATQPA